jgi:hypothetical protein
MQSLGLVDARRKAKVNVYRTDLEKRASIKKRASMYAIRSALAQCNVLRSGSDGDTPFANCVLARLYYILLNIDPESAEEVAELVRRCERTLSNDLFSPFHLTPVYAPFLVVLHFISLLFMLSSILCSISSHSSLCSLPSCAPFHLTPVYALFHLVLHFISLLFMLPS